MNFSALKKNFLASAPQADFCSLRFFSRRDELLRVTKGVVDPPQFLETHGVMVTVIKDGGLGYCAAPDHSLESLRQAGQTALSWARLCAKNPVVHFDAETFASPCGSFAATGTELWRELPIADKLALLQEAAAKLRKDHRIVDWEAAIWNISLETLLLTAAGGETQQRQELLCPSLRATAFSHGTSETRNYGSENGGQGGGELLQRFQLNVRAQEVAEEALQLVHAPSCPQETLDVLFTPDQMYLQIHESIGHPLEIDRILGDERNYAGTSFVTKEMFGNYRYGSELLNVVFDPGHDGELASYAFDDEGAVARRHYLIEKGILKRGIGSRLSEKRSAIPGIAASRAVSWNRPPIDRMGNINILPGSSNFEDMVAAVDRGILMKTNRSWSIDDSRNKFQFGCEFGQLIEHGKLTTVVRKPNYRGISAEFWRQLKMVGDTATAATLGSPFCGKGEPNQMIHVGHAAPACLFSGVAVFGGE